MNTYDMQVTVRTAKTSSLIAMMQSEFLTEFLEQNYGDNDVDAATVAAWIDAVTAEIDRRIPTP